MRFLCVGDLHIRPASQPFIEKLTSQIIETVSIEACNAVIFLGDILHHHGILEVDCALKMFKRVLESSPGGVYIIVGNHDYIDKRQFLTDKHWMNPLKEIPGLIVVDKVTCAADGAAILLPFVEEGRFLEALETHGPVEWRAATFIFAHQGFRGAQMLHGLYETKDEWDVSLPPIISGHIHGHQKLNNGIWYPGSIEETRRSYFLVADTATRAARAIEVGRAPSSSFRGSVKDILRAPDTFINAEITVQDSRAAIQEFQSGEKYRELSGRNSFKFIPEKLPFLTLYRRNVLDSGDVYALCAAERVLTGAECREEDHLLIKINN